VHGDKKGRVGILLQKPLGAVVLPVVDDDQFAALGLTIFNEFREKSGQGLLLVVSGDDDGKVLHTMLRTTRTHDGSKRWEGVAAPLPGAKPG
jgi:hypothetical protein